MIFTQRDLFPDTLSRYAKHHERYFRVTPFWHFEIGTLCVNQLTSYCHSEIDAILLRGKPLYPNIQSYYHCNRHNFGGFLYLQKTSSV